MQHAPDELSITEHLSVWVGRAIGKLYWILLGWWFDAPRARKREREFAHEIRENLPFLFAEYGAEIIPNEGVLPAAV